MIVGFSGCFLASFFLCYARRHLVGYLVMTTSFYSYYWLCLEVGLQEYRVFTLARRHLVGYLVMTTSFYSYYWLCLEVGLQEYRVFTPARRHHCRLLGMDYKILYTLLTPPRSGTMSRAHSLPL